MEANFNFNNRCCIALCLAKQADISLSHVKSQLLGQLSNGIENIPFNHNVRSALLSTGIYLLCSSGKVFFYFKMPFSELYFLSMLKHFQNFCLIHFFYCLNCVGMMMLILIKQTVKYF